MNVTKSVLLALVAGSLLFTAGCSFDLNNPNADEYDVQIIGDSIYDYSGDIQDILHDLSGKMYKDRSVSGEKIDGILTQYDRAIGNTPSLKTVLADGGGNDILQGSADCESDPLTQGCIDTVDYVADRMEVLLEDMYQDGVDDCIWLGYYYLKDSEAEKNEALDHAYTIYPSVFGDASLNLYGAGGAYLVDPRPNIVPSQIKSDDIHPTYSGSDVLANLIWNVMVAEDTYR
ncbi:hypothetical protein DSLASN_24220 [Desulfoluna limicola]|uniref:SGNH hydrolase-type esterase domain-containing protein n=1 Tax=Desulfoluna limicola TaxID=2810562 RepID=A0ABM7PHY4_9BACT|nr:hypothetical protein [Desulfoluna limicola]BCS96790.1 hypothetical protein DSLASN_24220 [Desulfoluna limicola]